MSRAVRLVLLLYPRAFRDRYGQEVADLLARSRRPVHDLADVARCALGERARALAYVRLRPHLHATTGLAAAPVAFAGAYLALYTLCVWGFVAVAAVAGSPGSHQAGRIASASAVLTVAAGAIWLAGHVRLPFTAALAPAGIAAGVLPVVLLTTIGTWPVVAAVGCWWVATGALSTVAVALVRRGRRRHAVLTMALGGVLACEVAFAVYGLLAFGSVSVAVGAYPVTALGIDPTLIGDSAGWGADVWTMLYALLTSCSAYALGVVTTARTGTATVPSVSRPS